MTRAASGKDGRTIEVSLTQAGLKLAARLEKQFQEALRPWTQRLNAADRQKLWKLMVQMLDRPGG